MDYEKLNCLICFKYDDNEMYQFCMLILLLRRDFGFPCFLWVVISLDFEGDFKVFFFWSLVTIIDNRVIIILI